MIASVFTGVLLNVTADMEDVTTTLLMDGNFVHDVRTFTVPFTAGSISSSWKMEQRKEDFSKC